MEMERERDGLIESLYIHNIPVFLFEYAHLKITVFFHFNSVQFSIIIIISIHILWIDFYYPFLSPSLSLFPAKVIYEIYSKIDLRDGMLLLLLLFVVCVLDKNFKKKASTCHWTSQPKKKKFFQ